MTRDPKWFGRLLRQLREQHGHTLPSMAARTGVHAIVIGSYERGDRRPTVERADALLNVYGMEFAAVPVGYDVPALLRERNELLAFKQQVVAAAEAHGLVVRPTLAAVPDGQVAA